MRRLALNPSSCAFTARPGGVKAHDDDPAWRVTRIAGSPNRATGAGGFGVTGEAPRRMSPAETVDPHSSRATCDSVDAVTAAGTTHHKVPCSLRGNRSTKAKPQRPRRSTVATKARKKEAGVAGGESDARAHGPALGGEAGSVLMDKLIRKVLPYATTSVLFRNHQWCIRHRHPLRRQPIELSHMPKGLRRVNRKIGYPAVASFHYVRLCGAGGIEAPTLSAYTGCIRSSLSANRVVYTIAPLLSSLKAVGGPAANAREASHQLTACDRGN